MLSWEPGVTIESAEKAIILQALKFYRGNKTQTAQSLGIAIRTLDNKLEKYDGEARDYERIQSQRKRDRDEEIERQRGRSLPSSSTGLRVEPFTQFAGESKMPMSERAEVQEVLPGPAPKSSEKRRSRSL